MLPDRRACARRSMAYLAKMPLLQLPNCQRTFAAEAARSVTNYRAHPSNNYRGCLTNGQRPTRQCILPGQVALGGLWPLAVACPPVGRRPLRWKRTIYRPLRTVSNVVQDRFYACPVAGQGPNLANFWYRVWPRLTVKLGNYPTAGSRSWGHYPTSRYCRNCTADGASHQEPHGYSDETVNWREAKY
jgi:hypothetical protein